MIVGDYWTNVDDDWIVDFMRLVFISAKTSGCICTGTVSLVAVIPAAVLTRRIVRVKLLPIGVMQRARLSDAIHSRQQPTELLTAISSFNKRSAPHQYDECTASLCHSLL
jgi:hypothetical protein